MNGIRAEVVAAQQLRAGHSVDQVVESTGLEPKEVIQIAQKLKLKAAPAVRDSVPGIRGMAKMLRENAGRDTFPKKARTLLERAATTIDQAVQAIDDDAGKAEKRAQIARLEEELRALKAEIKGTAAQAGQHRRDMRAVRAWARDNGYDVPNVGLVKKDIIDAYDQAQVAS